MTYIPSKPQRLYCKHCDETYSLPQNGSIKLYKVCIKIVYKLVSKTCFVAYLGSKMSPR